MFPSKPVLFLACCLASFTLAAQDTETTRDWTGEGALGITSTSGNTDSETINADLSIVKNADAWKHSAALKMIRAETDGDESADNAVLLARTEYSFSEKSYAFGQFRYEVDEFAGFEEQTSVTAGVGTRLIDSEKQFLDASLGIGLRKLKEQDTGDTEEDGVLTANAAYEYMISETSTFRQTLYIENGEENTYSEAETSLSAKIDGNLSMKLSYLVKRNSEVPDDTDKTDTITSISLVYGF